MTRKITLLALVPVLALGLAACGSSNADTGASAATSSMSSMPMPSGASTTTQPGQPSSTTEDGAAAVISITDFAYKVPASVAPGSTITIKNSDSQAHTVTSKTGGFDVKVDPNGTSTLTAPSKPGSYPFVCTFHANMTSTLVVK
ncbi:cupredoxin domain-containing protein [Pedococcus bigeumensis]|uniref:EfeO-type cupredoxin-like domain-containing protein n=1 Tax=Pedococcus bigeumensis TaxID=433644 RepID=A0A502CZD3_9MICO|nr:cupredoxin domain-containing protein [Pedococcus bigeumensis]TPG18193.1 hypothetical protein EAH86_07335 [Pedococcus bigeumensis]